MHQLVNKKTLIPSNGFLVVTIELNVHVNKEEQQELHSVLLNDSNEKENGNIQ